MMEKLKRSPGRHQYVDRRSGQLRTERFFADGLIEFLYSPVRENAPALFRALTSSRMSGVLGYLNFDLPLGSTLWGNEAFLRRCGVNLDECVDPLSSMNTARKVFERKIRYWECRPAPQESNIVLSPADARALPGSSTGRSPFFLKKKFFDFEEILGKNKSEWLEVFREGDFIVFRLTPDKYHYNHSPVAGMVKDFYEIDGDFHACNPAAVVRIVTPYSKNKRTVTIIDTDVPDGTGVGLVAMVEVVALMVGEIVQCYSEAQYEDPMPVRSGIFLKKGVPKSLFRPGSSTTLLFFQPGRTEFSEDLTENLVHPNAESRFSSFLEESAVETDVEVRSAIARAVPSVGPNIPPQAEESVR